MKLKIKNRYSKSILIIITLLALSYCMSSFIVSDCCSTETFFKQLNVTGLYKNNDLTLLVIQKTQVLKKGRGLRATDKDLKQLLAILQKNNAILLDTDMLTEALNKTRAITVKRHSVVNRIDRFTKLAKSASVLVSFGIYKELVDILHEVIS